MDPHDNMEKHGFIHIKSSEKFSSCVNNIFRMISSIDGNIITATEDCVQQWHIENNEMKYIKDIISPGNEYILNLISHYQDNSYYFIIKTTQGTHGNSINKIILRHINSIHNINEVTIKAIVIDIIPIRLNIFLVQRGIENLEIYDIKYKQKNLNIPAEPLYSIIIDEEIKSVVRMYNEDNKIVVLTLVNIEFWIISFKFCRLVHKFDLNLINSVQNNLLNLNDDNNYTGLAEEIIFVSTTKLVLKTLRNVIEISLRDLKIIEITCYDYNGDVETICYQYCCLKSVLVMLNSFYIENEESRRHVEQFIIRGYNKDIAYRIIDEAIYGDELYSLFAIVLDDMSTIIVLTTKCELYKITIPINVLYYIKYAELIKNARLIYQGFYQNNNNNLLKKLPIEIWLKIIAMTNENILTSEAQSIVQRNFSRPNVDCLTQNFSLRSNYLVKTKTIKIDDTDNNGINNNDKETVNENITGINNENRNNNDNKTGINIDNSNSNT